MRHALLFTTAMLWACSSSDPLPAAASQPAPSPAPVADPPAAASPDASSLAASSEISITYCIP